LVDGLVLGRLLHLFDGALRTLLQGQFLVIGIGDVDHADHHRDEHGGHERKLDENGAALSGRDAKCLELHRVGNSRGYRQRAHGLHEASRLRRNRTPSDLVQRYVF